MIKIAIIGSKLFKNTELIEKYVKSLNGKKYQILTGIAIGVNYTVRMAAKKYKIPITVYRPDFEHFGTQAIVLINNRILAESEIITFFYNGTSMITGNLIKEAKELKKEIELIVSE